MKEGRTLVALAEELDRQQESKEDYIVDTRRIRMDVESLIDEGIRTSADPKIVPTLAIDPNPGMTAPDSFPILTNAHRQIGERVGIPARYYDRMRTEAPRLLAENVNHWFLSNPEKRMIRTMDVRGDGTVQARAFLSNKYRRLDNYDLMQVVIPILQGKQDDGLRIESCDVTENRIYLKAVTERIEGQVRVGEIVQAGIVISNSEIGKGAVKVEPMIFTLSCSNGMIAKDHGMSQYHLGRAIGGGGEEGDHTRRLFKDDTLKADDNAFWRKVRDVVDGSLTQDVFDRILDEMRAAAEVGIEKPIEAVEVLAKSQGFTDTEKESTLLHLVQSGDTTVYGLSAAVTRMSQDVESYDRATELEGIGYSVLSLNAADLEAPARN